MVRLQYQELSIELDDDVARQFGVAEDSTINPNHMNAHSFWVQVRDAQEQRRALAASKRRQSEGTPESRALANYPSGNRAPSDDERRAAREGRSVGHGKKQK